MTDDEIMRQVNQAAHGQLMEEAEFRAIIEPLGRRLEQRTTLYGRTYTDPAPAPAG
jgi:2-iminoacetate synthase ThiH